MESVERREIEELLRRLPRKGKDVPIRRAVRAVLDGATDDGPDDGKALMRELCQPRSDRWRQSALACWTLGQIEVGPRTVALASREMLKFADRTQEDDNGE